MLRKKKKEKKEKAEGRRKEIAWALMYFKRRWVAASAKYPCYHLFSNDGTHIKSSSIKIKKILKKSYGAGGGC